METYPDAANEITAWTAVVEAVRWHNFDEVRRTFKDADSVEGYVIFNIRHNRYGLVTVIHYAKTTKQRQTQGHVYIRSFLTHKEYGNSSNWTGGTENNEHSSRKPGGNDCAWRPPRHTQR